MNMKSVPFRHLDSRVQQQIQDNLEVVQTYNMTALLHMQHIVCISLLIAIGIGLFLDAFRPCIPIYSLSLMLFFGIAEFVRRRNNPAYILHGLYLLVIVLALITFYISLIMFPHRPTAIACMFFGFIPMLFIARPCRYYGLLVLLYIVYSLLVIGYKGPEIGGVDAVNAFISTVIGICLGFLFLQSRLECFEAQRQLFWEKTTDVLTGLSNRRSLYEQMASIQAAKEPWPAGILMLDIDYFKHLNDTYGHAAGDTCLRRLGTLLKKRAANGQAGFYRYGGEEFVGLLWACDAGTLKHIAEEIRLQAQNTLSLTDAPITVSIGALYGADADVSDIEKWLAYADQALYLAKEKGRNRVICWKTKT